MEPFVRLKAIAAPLPMANIDTDKILAGQFLKTVTKGGLGSKLFWALREKGDFVLDTPPWTEAGILIALENFGCGSSREHAPWALLDFGIRCVIAPSFADIFYNNCFKNGILPITLPQVDVQALLELASRAESCAMEVDLPLQILRTEDGRSFQFEIDTQRKTDLIEGVDDIARTLALGSEIDRFEAWRKRERPWLVETVPDRL